MSLKRRNYIAWALLLLAAVFWTFGRLIVSWAGTTAEATTYATVAVQSSDSWTQYPPEESSEPATEGNVVSGRPGSRLLSLTLCFAAAAVAGVAVFGLRQRKAILGPDGVCIFAGVLSAVLYRLGDMDYIFFDETLLRLQTALSVAVYFSAGIAARELWGWVMSKFPLSWCLVCRAAEGSRKPQRSMFVTLAWVLLSVIGIFFSIFSLRSAVFPILAFLLTGTFGLAALWKYSRDLEHFQTQLENYQQGLPISVGDGAFGKTEARLLEILARQEEAVRTAVTSERFKVELISNVSHDLRTPLTAIVGYGELLEKEKLSPEGREQLSRLNQKAGYMNELVESLFELTKVSSGALPCKKERIDLIRLLEQTVGLFDDQLASAGLTVRRNYCGDAIPVVTDGARMHQVFANLLGNAIKYALAGTRIYVEVKELPDRCLVRMMNTASYEMDFQPEEIMQRFARGDKSRSTKGSGLGLAIAQTYTQSVGGDFRVSVDGDQFSAIVELPKTERDL